MTDGKHYYLFYGLVEIVFSPYLSGTLKSNIAMRLHCSVCKNKSIKISNYQRNSVTNFGLFWYPGYGLKEAAGWGSIPYLLVFLLNSLYLHPLMSTCKNVLQILILNFKRSRKIIIVGEKE